MSMFARSTALGAVSLCLLLGSLRASAQPGLRAAVAKVDITPKTHEVMWGFEDRLEPASSTLDPLYARVLVLEAGGKRLAIVTLDLGRSFGEPALDQLQAEVRKSSGISCLLVSASHTHSAPNVKDEYKGNPPEWERSGIGQHCCGHQRCGKPLAGSAYRCRHGLGADRAQPAPA